MITQHLLRETSTAHRNLGRLQPGGGTRLLFLLALCLLAACSESDGGPAFFEGDGADLLEGEHSPRGLAAGAGQIFFIDDQTAAATIAKLPVAGGDPVQLAGPTALPPRELVSDGQWVVWIEVDAGVGAVRRVPAAGGTTETVADGLQDPRALSIADGDIYYAESEADVIWLAPADGGEPVPLAGDVGALTATATDGTHLYFAQGYDAPHGAISRLALAGDPLSPRPVEALVSGLGAPYELLIVGEEICWRELQGDLIRCAPQAGGQARLLTSGQGYLPVSRPQLAADSASFFFAANDDIRRLPLGGGQIEIVARAGEFASINALVLVDDKLLWTDGSHLRWIDKTHTVPAGGGNDGGIPPGPGCPSQYDGTYIGQLVYEYDAGDPANPPLTVQTGSVALTVELSCIATAAGSTVLTISHAVADDPFFGCQLQGCTPKFGSVATLPAEAPTTPGNSSQSGQGLVILFPNSTSIGTANSAGALTVTSDARTLTSSLDPAIANSTWVAGSAPSGPSFPPARQQGSPVTRYKSWTLNKSAR